METKLDTVKEIYSGDSKRWDEATNYKLYVRAKLRQLYDFEINFY